jgi:acetyltransferase EpsM
MTEYPECMYDYDMRSLVIGAGAHALEVAELLDLNGDFPTVLLDKNQELIELSQAPNGVDKYYLGVGDPTLRLSILDRWRHNFGSFPLLIHRNSYISKSSELDLGVVVQFGSVISSKSSIGAGVLINWNSSVGHHVEIQMGCVINPNVTIAGNCSIGQGVLIGAGAQILAGIKIGAGAIIGAGAVVTKDIDPYTVNVGVPAKTMKSNA